MQGIGWTAGGYAFGGGGRLSRVLSIAWAALDAERSQVGDGRA